MITSCIISPKKYATRSTLENSPKKTVVFQEDSQVPTITNFQFSKNMSSLVRQDVDVKPGRDMKKVSISSSSDEGLGDLSFSPCSTLLPDIARWWREAGGQGGWRWKSCQPAASLVSILGDGRIKMSGASGKGVYFTSHPPTEFTKVQLATINYGHLGVIKRTDFWLEVKGFPTRISK